MPPRPPPSVAPPSEAAPGAWGTARRFISAGFAVSSLLSTWSAGVLGMAVVYYVGPPLGMLAQMYFAMNTEPHRPEAPFPWLMAVVTALAPLPLVWRRSWKLASLAAIPFALLPWWQLYLLYRLAGPG